MTENSKIPPGDLRFDEVGYWTEIKLDIVRKYAQAYSTILSKQRLSYSYIDGFAGPGIHLTKESGKFIPGSPLNALRIKPQFHEYYLIDLDGSKVDQLNSFQEIQESNNVHVIHGDCNHVLLNEVFPKVRYEDYRRALCILDPYGLHLDWKVIESAGSMKSIEIFLNFPIMDMNRNTLWHKPESVSSDQINRMTAFWGDDSWRQAAYARQTTLFGPEEGMKLGNIDVISAFRERLKNVADFQHVSEPLPMHNTKGAIVYYLVFASQKPVAAKIVEEIFDKYRKRLN
ncbi:three-Cys-motif partner protein TcmP [Candidatus Moduliflexota bacterium]